MRRSPRRTGRAVAWGVAIGVGAVVLRELVRPRDQQAQLIDWARVEEGALRRCGEDRDREFSPAQVQAYRALGAELAATLEQALGTGTAASGSQLYPSLQRSEEHTSELQSRGHLVCRLLLEKKKKKDLSE